MLKYVLILLSVSLYSCSPKLTIAEKCKRDCPNCLPVHDTTITQINYDPIALQNFCDSMYENAMNDNKQQQQLLRSNIKTLQTTIDYTQRLYAQQDSICRAKQLAYDTIHQVPMQPTIIVKTITVRTVVIDSVEIKYLKEYINKLYNLQQDTLNKLHQAFDGHDKQNNSQINKLKTWKNAFFILDLCLFLFVLFLIFILTRWRSQFIRNNQPVKNNQVNK